MKEFFLLLYDGRIDLHIVDVVFTSVRLSSIVNSTV